MNDLWEKANQFIVGETKANVIQRAASLREYIAHATLDSPPCQQYTGRMTDVELLRDAIARSGLSARRFASEILLRDERTCRRWLAGDSPIPAAVLKWLSGQPPSEPPFHQSNNPQRSQSEDSQQRKHNENPEEEESH